MKTEFLKGLGLEQDVIDKIMAENGKDVAAEQKKITSMEAERDNYKGQLETAQNALKEFEGVDVKELQGKIEKLNGDLSAKEKEYQEKIAGMEFDSKLESSITGAGARNAKAVKALLDIENLKASKNQDADIKAAIEACQKENDYLFGKTEPINNPVGPTDNPGAGSGEDSTASWRAAMGLPPIK